MQRRTPASVVRVFAVGAALVLLTSACSESVDPLDAVTAAKLQPQSLFVSQPTTACPDSPDAGEGQPAVPQAVCIEVKNTGTDTAAYAVAVSVQNKDKDAKVYSQVVLNTPPIPAGATGAVAVAAPGTENIITKPTDAQKAAGAIPAGDVRLNVTQVNRASA